MTLHPFKIIGIGATFSPNLKANLFEAARLCLFFRAKLVLIHVGEETSDKIDSFKEILQPFTEDGLLSEFIFTPGEPAEVILRTSSSLRIDLLIIGALQREKLVTYYVGSIARKITRKAKCSVLLLIKPSVNRIPCNHIVVNGLEDPKTEKTVRNAFYVAHHLGTSKITVVEEIREQEIHVHIDDDVSLRKATIVKEKLRRREDSRIQKIVAEVAPDDKEDITVESQAIFGRRGYSIGHYAEVVRADLLVMNAPTQTNFWDRLFPHDIEHILAELPTDVLIIR